MKKLQQLVLVTLISLVPTILLWVPFALNLPAFWKIPLPGRGFETIISNYDGPLYLVIAKTLYKTSEISQNYSFPLPTEYYAAHFPLFPLLIRLLGVVVTYPYAMVAITALSSIVAHLYFYLLANDISKDKTKALWLTFVFAILPARWLIVRSVGTPEPLFLAGILASIYYIRHQKYWLAGIAGVIAQLAKPPGVMLFIALCVSISIPYLQQIAVGEKIRFKELLKAYPIVLIPASLIGLFYYFSLTYTFNNVFAYFNSGDNIHLFFPPFQVFNYMAPWVDTHWLEEILFIYLFGAIAIQRLWNKGLVHMASFTSIFFLSLLFVSHRDVMRYGLPIAPFVLFAFSDYLDKKEFKYGLALILIPIYLYSLAFISGNVMPVPDWTSLL